MIFWCRRCKLHSRFPEVDHRSEGVSEDLDLDMAGGKNEPLYE